jgi:hypothetical protein
MLLAARALGLGATLTTLYLQFEKEAEAALGLPPGVHSYALLPIGYPMVRCAGLGQFAVSLSPMSSTKIAGASHTGIRVGKVTWAADRFKTKPWRGETPGPLSLAARVRGTAVSPT